MSMSDFIPDGFAPLADWDFRERQKQDGHSAEWKTLSDAAKAGKIPAFKLSNGRWYVHRSQAAKLLAEAFDSAADVSVDKASNGCLDGRRIESAITAMCEISNGLTLMHEVLERLTAAVEQIATQPRSEPARTWPDMNGESL